VLTEINKLETSKFTLFSREKTLKLIWQLN